MIAPDIDAPHWGDYLSEKDHSQVRRRGSIVAAGVGCGLLLAATVARAQSADAHAVHLPSLRVPLEYSVDFAVMRRDVAPRLLRERPLFMLRDLGVGLSAVPIDVPEHEAPEPSPFVSFEHNFVAEMMRVQPVDGWNWVGLGLGTASLGLAAVFFQVAGTGAPNFLPRFPGVNSADDPVAFALGGYRLRYDDIGSLTMQAGMNAISSNLFQLMMAPTSRRTVRYMRTFVTELRDGWLVGFQSSM